MSTSPGTSPLLGRSTDSKIHDHHSHNYRPDSDCDSETDSLSSSVVAAPASVESHKLSVSTRLWFAAPQFSANALGVITTTFLTKFYSDHYNVSLSLIAAVSFVASVVGLYVQVLVGWISDNTNTRWGRRRPYLAVITPLKELFFLALMIPPFVPSATGAATLWYTLFFIVYGGLKQSSDVLMSAFRTEATASNTERAKLYTVVNTGSILGVFVAAAMTTGLASLGKRAAFGIEGGTIATIGVISVLGLVYKVRERRLYARSVIPLVPAIRSAARNDCWITYFKAATLGSVINEIPGIFPFLYQYVYGFSSKDADSKVGIGVLVYAVSMLATIPLWYRLLLKRGKVYTVRCAYCCMVVFGILAFGAIVFFADSPNIMFGIITVLGASSGGLNSITPILLSDCIDYDELLSGKRREALYQSISVVGSEFFSVAGRSFPLIAMNIAGYVPNQTQPNSVKAVIVGFVSGIPIIIGVLAAWILGSYPINETMHNRILGAVETMHEKSEMIRAMVPNENNEFEELDDQDARPLCVQDPVTKHMVPVPAPSWYFRALDAPHAAVSESDATTTTSATAGRGPRARDSLDQDTAAAADEIAESEYLLDYFSIRELWIVQHIGVSRLRLEIVFSAFCFSIWTLALLSIGGILFANYHAPYTGFIFLALGSVASFRCFFDVMRLSPVNTLVATPPVALKDAIQLHRRRTANFGKHAGDMNLIAQADAEYHDIMITSVWRRTGSFLFSRTFLSVCVIVGAILMKYNIHEHS
jgi:glycoside/pentoside/hexuronide:cation symporter, GPH family